MIQAEKLAALGRFSSGLAHEIRNPLANISASAQICLSKYTEDPNLKRHFDIILRNTDNANRIIKELLDFTSPKEIEFKSGDATKALQHIGMLIKTRCENQKIKLSLNIENDLPEIMLNEKKLEESLLNFVSNAIEAMPNGGMLGVGATEDRLSGGLLISITDTGYGIAEENKDKIFEPFFTTKDDGTGLGMSLSYQIIKSHSGRLSLESEEGEGTSIKIKLPAAPKRETTINSNPRISMKEKVY